MTEVRFCEDCTAQAWASEGFISMRTVEGEPDDDGVIPTREAMLCHPCFQEATL